MNILIVDDETTIRSWLTLFINQLGEEDLNVYEADDGLDALAVCKERDMDLVITDIRMPRMNGIELIRELQTLSPRTRTVVLSAFEDFTYVKVALKNGALDYILKPEMSLDDITALLAKVRDSFSMEHVLSSTDEEGHQRLRTCKKRFQEFLDSGDAPMLLDAFRPSLEDGGLMLSIFKAEAASDIDPPANGISLLCESAMKSEGFRGVAFPYNSEHCILLYNTGPAAADEQRERCHCLLSLIDSSMGRYLDCSIAYSVNRWCSGAEALRDCFGESWEQVSRREYYGNEPRSRSDGELSQQMCRDYEAALERGDIVPALEQLLRYIDNAHGAQVSPRRLKAYVLSGVNQFSVVAQNKLGTAFPTEVFQLALFDIVNAPRAQLLYTAVEEVLAAYTASEHQAEAHVSPAIQTAKGYIDEHYQQKLTLDDVSKQVFLNRTYLSLLFKRELGIPFCDYVENVRITSARKLLQSTDLPISEVAESCGFSSQNYFTKVFGKRTGLSPMQYRRKSKLPATRE